MANNEHSKMLRHEMKVDIEPDHPQHHRVLKDEKTKKDITGAESNEGRGPKGEGSAETSEV